MKDERREYDEVTSAAMSKVTSQGIKYLTDGERQDIINFLLDTINESGFENLFDYEILVLQELTNDYRGTELDRTYAWVEFIMGWECVIKKPPHENSKFYGIYDFNLQIQMVAKVDTVHTHGFNVLAFQKFVNLIYNNTKTSATSVKKAIKKFIELNSKMLVMAVDFEDEVKNQ
jgi:hypothetical protein